MSSARRNKPILLPRPRANLLSPPVRHQSWTLLLDLPVSLRSPLSMRHRTFLLLLSQVDLSLVCHLPPRPLYMRLDNHSRHPQTTTGKSATMAMAYAVEDLRQSTPKLVLLLETTDITVTARSVSTTRGLVAGHMAREDTETIVA